MNAQLTNHSVLIIRVALPRSFTYVSGIVARRISTSYVKSIVSGISARTADIDICNAAGTAAAKPSSRLVHAAWVSLAEVWGSDVALRTLGTHICAKRTHCGCACVVIQSRQNGYHENQGECIIDICVKKVQCSQFTIINFNNFACKTVLACMF